MTSVHSMKRAICLALVLAVLAPVAPLVAAVWSGGACCAGDAGERVSTPMSCCETTMCASPSPARQPKAIDAPAPPAVGAPVSDAVAVTVASRRAESPQDVSSHPPTRIRLALIATLLI